MSNPAFEVKNKMTVAVNASNFETVKEFVNDLPENSGVANISNLLLYLIRKVKNVNYEGDNESIKELQEKTLDELLITRDELIDAKDEVINLKSELQKVNSECVLLRSKREAIHNTCENLKEKIVRLEGEINDSNELFDLSFNVFKDETSQAMKMLFNNNDLRPLNNAEMLELMLDYCRRDPSSEFPFEPVATKIYKNILSENNGEKRAETTTGNGETGAGNTVTETVNNGAEGDE